MDDLRKAAHECGHVVAEWMLTGELPLAVSIEAGQSFQAVTVRTTGRSMDFGRHDNRAPLCLADPAIRQAAESEIIVSLAGREAEMLAGVPPTALDAEPDVITRTAATAREALPARARERLEIGEAIPAAADPLDDPHTDEADAAALIYRLVGTRGNYLGWMRSEARSLVLAHSGLISRLAAELLGRRILSGAECRAILESEAPLP
jgi:hypothetical protein